jgi:hypothetical protein
MLIFIAIFIVAIVVYRNIIFEKGVITGIDKDYALPFVYGFPSWPERWIWQNYFSWFDDTNWGVSCGHPFLPIPILLYPFIKVLGAELSEKLIYLFFTAFAGLSSYYMVSVLLFSKGLKRLNSRESFVCLISSLSYMLSPWIVNKIMFGGSYLFSYPLLPLLTTLIVKNTLLRDPFIRINVAKEGITISIIFALLLAVDFALAYIMFSFTLFTILISFFRKKCCLEILKTEFKLWVLATFLTFLLSSYWILPSTEDLFEKLLYRLQFIPIEGLSAVQLYGNLLNSLRIRGSGYPYLEKVEAAILNNNPIFLLSTFMLPIIAFSASLFKPRDKKVLFFSGVALFSIFLSKGINEPYGGIYWWLLFNIPFFSGLTESFKWLALTSVCYSFLISATVSELVSMHEMDWNLQRKTFGLNFLDVKIAVKLILCSATLLFIIVINPFVALSGDFGGFVKPLSIPNDYYAVASILNNNENGSVLLLPLDAYNLAPVWASVDMPYMHDPFTVCQVRPVITKQLIDQRQFYLIKFIDNIIYYNRTMNLGSILSYFNIKFIVVHKDLNISRYAYPECLSWGIFWINPDRILIFLKQQNDLIQIYDGRELALFKVVEKSNEITTCQNPVIGSLDALCKLADHFPNSSPLVFFVDLKYVKLLEKNVHKIIFYDKNATDVLFGLVPSEYLIYAYKFAKVSQLKDQYWVVSQFLPVRSEVVKIGDLPFNQVFAFTSGKGIVLQIPFIIKEDGNYEIWGRLWFGTEAGTVKITFKNEQIMLNTFSPIPGFRWIRLLGSLPLLKGEYQLKIENIKGQNAIDSLAIIPTSLFEELQSDCLTLLSGKSVTYMSSGSWIEIPVYDGWTNPVNWSSTFKDKFHVARYYSGRKSVIRTDGKESEDTLSFSSLEECPYEFPEFSKSGWNAYYSTLVYMVTDEEPVRIDAVYADEKTAPIVGVWWNSGWVGMGTKPIEFPIVIPSHQRVIIQIGCKANKVTILFGNTIKASLNAEELFGKNQIGYIQLKYEKIDPTKYIIHVNASKPFFLIFSKSYDEGWKACYGTSDSLTIFFKQPILEKYHFIANGYANAWYIDPKEVDGDGDGCFMITLYYLPQSLFYLGLIISSLTFAVCIGYLLYDRKLRKRNSKLKSSLPLGTIPKKRMKRQNLTEDSRIVDIRRIEDVLYVSSEAKGDLILPSDLTIHKSHSKTKSVTCFLIHLLKMDLILKMDLKGVIPMKY